MWVDRAADSAAPTIFDKIVSKAIPADIIYEDDTALAFRDINPQAPVHFLVIPKQRDGLTQLQKADERHEKLLGHLLLVAGKVAKQGVAEPYFLIFQGLRLRPLALVRVSQYSYGHATAVM